MSIRWNDIFKLPGAALAGDALIDAKVLATQAGLTKHEQKTLDKVRRLEHFASVQKSTARILPRIDDERNIQSIIFLRCEMVDSSQAVAEVAHLLHKCFPNPTIVMQEAGDKVCLSVSLMRKSLAEQGATVVEHVESTGLFRSKATEWQSFLTGLGFEHLPQEDLLAYLQAIAGKVMLSRAIDALGFYPQARPENHMQILVLVKRYDSLRIEINKLYIERRGSDVTLNESAKLKIRIREMEKQRDAILAEIKELCHE